MDLICPICDGIVPEERIKNGNARGTPARYDTPLCQKRAKSRRAYKKYKHHGKKLWVPRRKPKTE